MNNTFYQQFIIFSLVVVLGFGLTSCDKAKRASKSDITVTHAFPNGNWAFEEEVLAFDFDITDTTKDYQIGLTLVFDTAVAVLKDIPLSVTLNTPDGMRSVATSHFNLNKSENSGIRPTGNGSLAETEVVIFPKRQLKSSGKYHLTVYRRAEKADNYGFSELLVNVKTL